MRIAHDFLEKGSAMERVDAAVIGCKAAGKPLAVALADAGFTVAAIERSKRVCSHAIFTHPALTEELNNLLSRIPS